MRRRAATLLLSVLLVVGFLLRSACGQTSADHSEPVGSSPRERDFSDTVSWLRQRLPQDVGQAEVSKLVTKLGSASYREREEAAERLRKAGPYSVPSLLKTASENDKERARRASLCLSTIQREWDVKTVLRFEAAVREVASVESDAAVETLFLVLPMLCEDLEEHAWFALDRLARQRGGLKRALTFLRDAQSPRRAAAAYLLCRHGDTKQRLAGGTLLSDPDPSVRLRTAQALLSIGDKSPVPVLIRLLDEGSLTVAWQAEELLRWLAGDLAITQTVGTTQEQASKCRSAWTTWWQQHQNKTDVAISLREPRKPLLLLVQHDAKLPSQQYVCGWDGVPRWHFSGSARLDQVLLNDRLLFCEAKPDVRDESNPRSRFEIVEKTTRGDVIAVHAWDRPEPPHTCYRLLNGQTVILDGPRLSILDTASANMTHCQAGTDTVKGDTLSQVWPIGIQGGHVHYVVARNVEGARVLSNWLRVDPANAAVVQNSPIPKGAISAEFWPRVLANGNLIVSGRGRWAELSATGEVWHRLGQYESVDPLPEGGKLIHEHSRRRVFELNRENAMVMEVPICATFYSGQVKRILPLVRMGFGDAAAGNIDISRSVDLQVAGLRSKQPSYRFLASQVVAKDLGPKALTALPALIDALALELAEPVREWDLRRSLVDAVLATGPESFDRIAESVRDQRAEIRAAGFVLLGGFRSRYSSAYTDHAWVLLTAGFRDSAALARFEAICASAFFKDKGEDRLPVLIKALKDRSVPNSAGKPIAAWAATALAGLGSRAKPAMPFLIEAVSSEEVETRGAALKSVLQLAEGDEASIAKAKEVYLKTLKNSIYPVPWQCIEGLHKLQIGANDATPRLTALLLDKRTAKPVRLSAINALRRYGSEAADTAGTLIRLFDDSKDIEERRAIMAALLEMRADPAQIEPVLRRALRDSDVILKHLARDGLRKLSKQR